MKDLGIIKVNKEPGIAKEFAKAQIQSLLKGITVDQKGSASEQQGIAKDQKVIAME